METPVVTKVAVIRPFTLQVTFKDGKSRVVDMTDEVKRRSGVFEPLKDPEYFALAFVDPVSRTVAWPNDLDLAPEWLYEPDPVKWQKLVEENRSESVGKRQKSRKRQNARL
jgi:uncharacterized protein DUF2442